MSDVPERFSQKNKDDHLVSKIAQALHSDSTGNANADLLSNVLFYGDDDKNRDWNVQHQRMKRMVSGQLPDRDEGFLDSKLELAGGLANEILKNPLTKEALPREAMGYLNDRFERIVTSADQRTAMTLDQLKDYQRTRAAANPLEQEVLKFAVDHFADFQALAGNGDVRGLTKRALSVGLDNLRNIQQRSDLDGGVPFLIDNFFKISQATPEQGITAGDLDKFAQANPQHADQIYGLKFYFDAIRNFDKTDGDRGWTSSVNAEGVTARDLNSWLLDESRLKSLGLSIQSGKDARDYYATTRRTTDAFCYEFAKKFSSLNPEYRRYCQ